MNGAGGPTINGVTIADVQCVADNIATRRLTSHGADMVLVVRRYILEGNPTITTGRAVQPFDLDESFVCLIRMPEGTCTYSGTHLCPGWCGFRKSGHVRFTSRQVNGRHP